MLIGHQIPELVHLLKTREMCLYHACQYQDFISYFEVGGIPSRQLLENSRKRFTAFETDRIDHENGVWNKDYYSLQLLAV